MKNKGLTTKEAHELQLEYGKNLLIVEKKESFIKRIFHTMMEPMFLLLLVASIIYFILGEPRDGAIMLIFIVGIMSIDIIQEWKTDKTLKALKDLSAPHIKVIRDGEEKTIPSEDLVPTDLMIIYEGVKIPADGYVIDCNDLCIDESSLTGEPEGVWKTKHTDNISDDYWKKDYCYAGTLVTKGMATILVDKIGSSTEYGKIGTNIAEVPNDKTPLQKQTKNLVKLCAWIAVILMVMVGIVTFLNLNGNLGHKIIQSILSGITVAMAMIPEEFPVILTVFLSLGAWRLAKKKSLVRKLPSVETLGAISVLCVDKTGTITMNQMEVSETYGDGLYEIAGLACETNAYDPMEKAILKHCELNNINTKELFNKPFIGEYSFTDELKMMGHIWNVNGTNLLAAKGSPEHILKLCDLNNEDEINNKIKEMSVNGLRVIAVAKANLKEIPENITDCNLTFVGLIGLADPPREGIKENIEICDKAGIRLVMITGDNGITAEAIANKIGMKDGSHIITGQMLDSMTDIELKEAVKKVNIFSRVIPEHKMRIVKALKENGEIVAMTGDGVNDAPALKFADIGIAMGKRGSEVSREAADLILMDDNFTTIVETVKDGRRIYDNIKKAVGYVFTIHTPIALACLLAPLLGIGGDLLMLLPIHIVLLELIIDPTCSIVFERQPSEPDIMNRKPRNPKRNIVDKSILLKSLIQGLVIFIFSFGTYYLIFKNNGDADLARSMALVIIMLSNLFLVQVNSSNHELVIKSLKKIIKDKIIIAVNVITVLAIVLLLYTPLRNIVMFVPLSLTQITYCLIIAFVSVFWYEIIKLFKKM